MHRRSNGFVRCIGCSGRRWTIGLIAKATLSPSEWSSTTRPTECSIYTVGLTMPERIKARPQQALAAVIELSELVAPNWG